MLKVGSYVNLYSMFLLFIYCWNQGYQLALNFYLCPSQCHAKYTKLLAIDVPWYNWLQLYFYTWQHCLGCLMTIALQTSASSLVSVMLASHRVRELFIDKWSLSIIVFWQPHLCSARDIKNSSLLFILIAFIILLIVHQFL